MTTPMMGEQPTHAGEFRSESAPARIGADPSITPGSVGGRRADTGHPRRKRQRHRRRHEPRHRDGLVIDRRHNHDNPAWAHASLSPFRWKDPIR